MSSIVLIRFIYPFNQYHNLYQIVIVWGHGTELKKKKPYFLKIDFKAVQPFGDRLIIHPLFIFLSNIQMLSQNKMS